MLTVDQLTRPEHVVGTAQINLVTMLLTVDQLTRREHVVRTAQVNLITVLSTVDKSTRRDCGRTCSVSSARTTCS